jgi:hypothetical protein
VGDEEMRDPVYTPVGVFITAYARDITIRAAQQHYDQFLYADTDSLHLLGDSDPSTLDVDPHKLGAWKYEGMFDKAIYVRAKCYSEHMVEDGHGNKIDEQVTHIAGLPDTIAEKVRLTDFYNGKVFQGKLLPSRVKGGIVLSSTGFTLNM